MHNSLIYKYGLAMHFLDAMESAYTAPKKGGTWARAKPLNNNNYSNYSNNCRYKSKQD